MDDYVNERKKICKECAIMRLTDFGMKCDNRRWLNPETNESSYFKHDGWVKGCGCDIDIKVKRLGNHCPGNKW